MEFAVICVIRGLLAGRVHVADLAEERPFAPRTVLPAETPQSSCPTIRRNASAFWAACPRWQLLKNAYTLSTWSASSDQSPATAFSSSAL